MFGNIVGQGAALVSITIVAYIVSHGWRTAYSDALWYPCFGKSSGYTGDPTADNWPTQRALCLSLSTVLTGFILSSMDIYFR